MSRDAAKTAPGSDMRMKLIAAAWLGTVNLPVPDSARHHARGRWRHRFYTALHPIGPAEDHRPNRDTPGPMDDIALVYENERLLVAGLRSEAPCRADTVTHTSQVCLERLEGATKMNGTWRDEWPPFRIKLVEETARCIVEQRALTSRGAEPSWAGLTAAGQALRIEAVAALFDVQDLAMDNLMQRGELP